MNYTFLGDDSSGSTTVVADDSRITAFKRVFFSLKPGEALEKAIALIKKIKKSNWSFVPAVAKTNWDVVQAIATALMDSVGGSAGIQKLSTDHPAKFNAFDSLVADAENAYLVSANKRGTTVYTRSGVNASTGEDVWDESRESPPSATPEGVSSPVVLLGAAAAAAALWFATR